MKPDLSNIREDTVATAVMVKKKLCEKEMPFMSSLILIYTSR